MRVALIGPIAAWWEEWGSSRHQQYVVHRDNTQALLVAGGHLVYAPHRAWQGNWDENNGDATAQELNDLAIRVSHAVVNLTPRGVPSPGTAHEMQLCSRLNRPVIHFPPAATSDLLALLKENS